MSERFFDRFMEDTKTENFDWDKNIKVEDRGSVNKNNNKVVGRVVAATLGAAVPAVGAPLDQVELLPPQIQQASDIAMQNRGPTVAEGKVRIAEQQEAEQLPDGATILSDADLTESEFSSINSESGEIQVEAGSALSEEIDKLNPLLNQLNQNFGEDAAQISISTAILPDGSHIAVPYIEIKQDNVNFVENTETPVGTIVYTDENDDLQYLAPKGTDGVTAMPMIVMVDEQMAAYLNNGSINGQSFSLNVHPGEMIPVDGVASENGVEVSVVAGRLGGEPVSFNLDTNENQPPATEEPNIVRAKVVESLDVAELQQRAYNDLAPSLKAEADAGRITYSPELSGFTRTNPETNATEVWRAHMSQNPENVEAGWLTQMDVYTSTRHPDTKFVIEMNPQQMADRSIGFGFDQAHFTDDFKTNIEDWIDQFGQNLIGQTTIFQLVSEYDKSEDFDVAIPVLGWQGAKSYIAVGTDWVSREPRVFAARLFFGRPQRDFPNHPEDGVEEIMSIGFGYALQLSAQRYVGPDPRAAYESSATYENRSTLRPRDVSGGYDETQQTKLVDISGISQ